MTSRDADQRALVAELLPPWLQLAGMQHDADFVADMADEPSEDISAVLEEIGAECRGRIEAWRNDVRQEILGAIRASRPRTFVRDLADAVSKGVFVAIWQATVQASTPAKEAAYAAGVDASSINSIVQAALLSQLSVADIVGQAADAAAAALADESDYDAAAASEDDDEAPYFSGALKFWSEWLDTAAEMQPILELIADQQEVR